MTCSTSAPEVVLCSLFPICGLVQEAGATGEDSTAPASGVEIIPPPTAAPGSAAERQAYLQGKLGGDKSGGPATNDSLKNAQKGAEAEATEEFVGEEGGDAMIEMLSAFDDDSGDE